MIRQWFDVRAGMGREAFLAYTTLTWLIGHLCFIGYFLATTDTYSFAALGRVIDHPAETVGAIERAFGWPLAGLALVLWGAQVWALLMMSAKRLRDMGKGEWLAGLSLIPGLRVVFWLALCNWPAKGTGVVRTA